MQHPTIVILSHESFIKIAYHKQHTIHINKYKGFLVWDGPNICMVKEI